MNHEGSHARLSQTLTLEEATLDFRLGVRFSQGEANPDGDADVDPGPVQAAQLHTRCITVDPVETQRLNG